MEDTYNDYLYSDPYDAPISITSVPSFLELLGDTNPKLNLRKKLTTKKKRDTKMDTTKKAFDIGAARATREFMKSAGAIEALIGAQAKDPRKALVLSTMATLGLAGLAGHGLSGGLAGETGSLIGPGISKALGTLGGLGALGTAAYMGSTAPGLLTPTTIEQRLASEVAAKLQNPETMGATVKHLGMGGLAALAYPL